MGRDEEIPLKMKVRKKPVPRRYSTVEYDFLKYIHLVFKWATVNYPDLSRRDIEILLYFYAEGVFTKSKFAHYYKPMGLYQSRKLRELINKGYISMWRPRMGKNPRLYELTTKAKKLCNKLHRFCCGVEEMSINPKHNELAKKDKPQSYGYYLDIVKDMNKDKPKED